MKTISFVPLVLLPFTATAALFECNKNQHAYNPTAGRFVVHYTSIRDQEFDGKPWIRICFPSDDGEWDNVEPLGVRCDQEGPVSFQRGTTGLNGVFKVWNGNGCNKDSDDLDGAKMEYDGQVRDLSGEDSGCGKRDHGITCEFDM